MFCVNVWTPAAFKKISDPKALLRAGRWFSAAWAAGLIGAALLFHLSTGAENTPVVVLALSIASITYGGLLGTYLLAGRWPRARGRDVIGAVTLAVAVMLVVVFANQLAAATGPAWLRTVGRLAWPWYVPLGTAITVVAGILLSYLPARGGATP